MINNQLIIINNIIIAELNNILLLEAGEGVQDAHALWCSFRVEPPFE